MSRQTVLDFINAINQHNTEKIINLMSNDHRFIDTYGHSETKEEMAAGWAGYFEWFPDYLIEVEDLFIEDDIVAIFGFASGTYRGTNNYWRLPASWRVVVDGQKVKTWQVYCDSKIPYESMEE